MTETTKQDALVGVFVLAGLLALGYLSFSIGGLGKGPAGGLRLVAAFDEIGGLKVRAPVVIAGVRVGQVESIDLGKDYRAHVTLDLEPTLALPVDTSASIMTAGILGDRYVSLQLGGETETLANGDEITFTESAVLLERLIGKLVHNADIGGKDEEKKE
jgi:phospholipid/cholesterol/gamma-HCH transport system substrate-binding protein